MHARVADIIGILVAFSVDLAKQLPLSYWQCVQSLMHGMRTFVAALTSMTKRTHASRPMYATTSARFAMEIGRAVLAVAIRDPNSVSIPIDQYIGVTTSAPFVIVPDASPTGMCAALYHPATGAIAAWGEINFPYDRDVRAQYQGNQEYLGHLFSLIVWIAHIPAYSTTRQHMWINDNTGAPQWAAAQKCSSMASHSANLAVTHLHIVARLRMVPPVHKPGIKMGDIDSMSRLSLRPTKTRQ